MLTSDLSLQQISSSSSSNAKSRDMKAGVESASGPLTPSLSHGGDSVLRRPRLISPSSPLRRSTSRSSSFKGGDTNDEATRHTLSSLSKYAEAENEGYDDVFAAEEDVRFGCEFFWLVHADPFILAYSYYVFQRSTQTPLIR